MHPESLLPPVPLPLSCLEPASPVAITRCVGTCLSSCCLLNTHLIYTHRSTGFALLPLPSTAMAMPPAIIILFLRMLHSSQPKQPLYTCMPLQSLLSCIWVRLSDLPHLWVDLCHGELFMNLLYPSLLTRMSFSI